MSGVSAHRALIFTKEEWGPVLLNNTSLFFSPRTPVIITEVDEDICKKGEEAQEAKQDLKPCIAALFNKSISPYQKEFKYVSKAPPLVSFSSETRTFKMIPSSPLELRSSHPLRCFNFETFIWNAIHSDNDAAIEMEPHQILWLDDIHTKTLPDEEPAKIKELEKLLKFNLPTSHKLKIHCEGELFIRRLVSNKQDRGLSIQCSQGFTIKISKNPKYPSGDKIERSFTFLKNCNGVSLKLQPEGINEK